VNRSKRISMAVLCAAVSVGSASAMLLIESAAQAQTVVVLNGAPISVAEGKQIYEHICQGCHMPDAKGAAGAGKYPPLAGDPALASRQFMALTLLMGRRNMPAFGSKHAIGFGGPPVLTSAQIAAVVNYVRTNFGNHFTDAITPEEVTALDTGAK
jgi:mono/diheme cytochrome c family protein